MVRSADADALLPHKSTAPVSASVSAQFCRSGGRYLRADTMREEWKEFAEGHYEVSTQGRVRRAKPGVGTWVGRILTPTLQSRGYPQISIRIAGRVKAFTVHRLVAQAFIGPCPKGRQVNHKDGDKTNNALTNLEYVTALANIRHAYHTGLKGPMYTDALIEEACRLRRHGLSYREIGLVTGMSRPHCWSVINGTRRQERNT